MGASRDFTRIRIPRVLLGIYRMQALQLNKGNFDEKNLYYIHIFSKSFRYVSLYIQEYLIPVSIAIYINHEHFFQKSNGANRGTNSHKE